MVPQAADIARILPEILWCGFGVFLMLLQPVVKNRQVLTLFAMVGAALGTLSTLYGQPQSWQDPRSLRFQVKVTF